MKHGDDIHVGTIVGWLSAEDNDGDALWHLKHDGSDSEDLDEEEAAEAVKAFAAAAAEDEPEWRKDSPFVGQRATVVHEGTPLSGLVVGWLSADDNDGDALWHLKHDSTKLGGDSDSEDLDEDEVKAAVEEFKRLKSKCPPPQLSKSQCEAPVPSNVFIGGLLRHCHRGGKTHRRSSLKGILVAFEEAVLSLP